MLSKFNFYISGNFIFIVFSLKRYKLTCLV